jgi:hypothetical protein
MLLVLSNATAGDDETFNDWYTNTHLAEVLATGGFSAAQRFIVADTQLQSGEPAHRYGAIYEVEDIDQARAALQAASFTMTPTLDRSTISATFLSAISDRVTP